MDRAAIFIDAGYYYAQGSYAAFGRTLRREQLEADEPALVRELVRAVSAELPAGCELLRTYWYDGATAGGPNDSHDRVAEIPRVKLRLGKINAQGRQKGVDTLIVRDLMVLSQERSISYAFLLSGDEDIREGVSYAQDRGVVVGLLGIRGTSGGTSQSRELIREADLVIDVEQVTAAATASLAEASETGETGDEADRREVRAIDAAPAERDRAIRDFLARLSPAERNLLPREGRSIPSDIDRQLLYQVSQSAYSGQRLTESQKRALRNRFWELAAS